jgi:hypothetical protein
MISVDSGVRSGGESDVEEQREAGPMRASRSPWIRGSSLVGILMGLSDYMAIENSNHGNLRGELQNSSDSQATWPSCAKLLATSGDGMVAEVLNEVPSLLSSVQRGKYKQDSEVGRYQRNQSRECCGEERRREWIEKGKQSNYTMNLSMVFTRFLRVSISKFCLGTAHS